MAADDDLPLEPETRDEADGNGARRPRDPGEPVALASAGVVTPFGDITRRKTIEMELEQAAAALERQTRIFDMTLSSIADFAYIFDKEGRFVFANQPLARLLQLTPDELVGKNFFDLNYPPDLSEKLQQEIQHVFETKEIVRDETPFTSPAGQLGYYEYIFQPLLGPDGKVENVVGSTRDVTSRKIAERALAESEERYRTLFDLVPVAVYSIDADGVIQEFNRRAVELWGRVPEKNAEKFCASFKLFHRDGTPMSRDECPMARVLRGEQLDPSDCEIIVEQGDGARRNVSVSPSVRRNERGEITGAINCFFDITESKRVELALRESEERFRTVADNVPQIIWTNEPDGKANYFNRRWYEFSGLSPKKSVGPGWQAIVHPDDASASVERWQRTLAAGKVFDVEYRLRRADGIYRWHIGRNVPLRHNGTVLGWFGSATDIEDLKQAEAALRESQQRFELLVEGTPDYAMFLLNRENEITFWSAGAEKVFGWSAEEAVGQTGALIFTPEDRARGAVEKEIGIARDKGRAPDRGWHLRKDGTRLWVDGVMRRIDRNGGGGIRGYAKIARDATELHRAEEELTYARDQLEQRVLERTAELMAMNNELERAMAGRLQLEREILQVTERERARIGQDLHDILCQELTATALFLKSSVNRAREKSTATALNEAAEIVNRNVTVARDLARGFQPALAGSGGLISALRGLCKKANGFPEVHCKLKLPRSIRIRDDTIVLNLFRVAQEAVRNALTHANATEIVICIEREHDLVRLVVEDNGKGFRERKRRKGLGLHIMRYRASALGGTLMIDLRPKGGTKIACEVPVRK
ncbi:MAG: two-component system, chemotaxis family, CheB/CheR fusion protein [Verrucomicrobiota bacterium]|jgi:PAS domain S-box-containing protein